ncbi:hypothetical protein PG995_004325 [Apiospora arundinis]
MAHERTTPDLKPKGYPKLAKFMVEHDYAMIKQFRQLAVRDLLYQQAEICELELEFTKQGVDDANAQDDRKYYDREWWFLSQGEARGTGGEQWKLAVRIRENFENTSISTLNRPSHKQRKQLHKYINSASLGGLCRFLGKDLGQHKNVVPVYDEKNLDDLLFLREDTLENDLLSHLLTGPILTLFHHVWHFFKRAQPYDASEAAERGEQERTSLYFYKDNHVRLVTNLIGSGVSSLLPMLSIVALFCVKDTPARLGLVCAFTFVFSVCLFAATQCKRVEIFAATAAYVPRLEKPRHSGAILTTLFSFASVQVVFVGTTSGPNA